MPDTVIELEDAATQLVKKHKKEIDQIIQWEAEADALTGEADNYRLQAATGIVKLLDGGATERIVAQAIGKSDSHVHHAKVAWSLMQGDTTIPDFNTAYKMAKRPAAERNGEAEQPSSPSGSNSSESADETPFPPWAKQMREFKRLSAEMLDQCNASQVKSYSKALESLLKKVVQKEEDFNYEQEQA